MSNWIDKLHEASQIRSKGNLEKNKCISWITINIIFILLSGCQQVIDRLESDFKGLNPTLFKTSTSDEKLLPENFTPQKNTTSNILTTGPEVALDQTIPTASTKQDYKPAKNSASHTTETHAQTPSPVTLNKPRFTRQVPVTDEDGNPLLESKDAKKSNKLRVYLED